MHSTNGHFSTKIVLLKCFQPSPVTSESECVELSLVPVCPDNVSAVGKGQVCVFASLSEGSSLEC